MRFELVAASGKHLGSIEVTDPLPVWRRPTVPRATPAFLDDDSAAIFGRLARACAHETFTLTRYVFPRLGSMAVRVYVREEGQNEPGPRICADCGQERQ